MNFMVHRLEQRKKGIGAGPFSRGARKNRYWSAPVTERCRMQKPMQRQLYYVRMNVARNAKRFPQNNRTQDICSAKQYVRFTHESDIKMRIMGCPLRAKRAENRKTASRRFLEIRLFDHVP